MDLTLAVLIGGLFAVGLHLMMTSSLIRVALGFILVGHAANLVLMASAGAGADPITGGPADPAGQTDPLPQAMALTAIVITFGVTTLLLALGYRSWRSTGRDEVPEKDDAP